MPIRLKVARTEQEVDDALWVRHEVFVRDDGKFGGRSLPEGRLIDRFDAFPHVYNIIVYQDEEPIATMRLIRECRIGLPAFKYYDFATYRHEAQRDLKTGGEVIIGSAGMLAIRKQWRSRRDVIRAMFKVAAGVCMQSGATHIVAVVNHGTANMYRRLGFRSLCERFWVNEIGNHVIPLGAAVSEFYRWAFTDLAGTPLNTFRDSFERLILRAGETVFSEGEAGSHAYTISSGEVRISRRSPCGNELTLAYLGRGDLFGELALVDNAPRSATVVAVADTELMTLNRHAFIEELYTEPQRVQQLLEVFAQRLRRMDEFATVLAFAPPAERLAFALNAVRNRSSQQGAQADRIFRGGAQDLATWAAVDEATVSEFLEERRQKGEIEYSPKEIRFIH